MSRKTFSVSHKRKTFKSNEQKNKKFTPEYETARRIRGTGRWKDLSRVYKLHYPMCQWCQDAPTEETHHIRPVTTHPELAYRPDNLLGMCRDCHDVIHARMNQGEDVETEAYTKKEEGPTPM